MEWNDTLYDNFHFLTDYLSALSIGDIFPGFTIKILRLIDSFGITPSFPDNLWTQSEPKSKAIKGQYELFGL
jgi:hypothetical protein